MRSSPPSWVDPLMRFGYAARGVVYVLVGTLAFTASIRGGGAPDSKSAVAELLNMPLGTIMLTLISLGLAAYAMWKLIDGVLDLDDKGSEAKGWAARAAQIISGLVHIGLAFSIAMLAVGRGSSQNNQNVDHWTAVLMQQPLGRWLVAAVGLVALAIGIQHFVRAYREKYKESMRYTPRAERLDPVLKLGLTAHGTVIVMIGTFFLWAAWTSDPSRAGGMREALLTLRDSDGGQTLFVVMALGLLGFAVYCFLQAAYRIVPRCVPKDFQTLASKAREVKEEVVEAMKVM